MFNTEITKYKSLNQLAESDGIVIFGENSDVNLPLGELKQAFALNDRIYNRSFSNMTVAEASNIYDECIAALYPDTVLLHIGENDISDSEDNTLMFEANYRSLIAAIRNKNRDCRIVIISLKNYDNNDSVKKLNKILKKIAEMENCEFEDISAKCVWDIKKRNEVTSFLYDIGFVKPLKTKRPIYNLVRILFCYDG